MLFSVIVPMYNASKSIRLSGQYFAAEHDDYEVIIINDESTDDSGLFAEDC